MTLSEIATDEALSRMSGLERFEVGLALHAGEKFGYGNVMSWLATAWAMKLRDEGLSIEACVDFVSRRGPLLPPLSNLKKLSKKKKPTNPKPSRK